MLTFRNRIRKLEADPAPAALRWLLLEFLDRKLVLDEQLLGDLERIGWRPDRVLRSAGTLFGRGELRVVHGSRPVTYVLVGGG